MMTQRWSMNEKWLVVGVEPMRPGGWMSRENHGWRWLCFVMRNWSGVKAPWEAQRSPTSQRPASAQQGCCLFVQLPPFQVDNWPVKLVAGASQVPCSTQLVGSTSLLIFTNFRNLHSETTNPKKKNMFLLLRFQVAVAGSTWQYLGGKGDGGDGGDSRKAHYWQESYIGSCTGGLADMTTVTRFNVLHWVLGKTANVIPCEFDNPLHTMFTTFTISY